MYLLHRTQLNLNFSSYQQLPSCWSKCKRQGSTSQANKIPTPQTEREALQSLYCVSFSEMRYGVHTQICNTEFLINKTNNKWRYIYHKIAWTRPIRKHFSEDPLNQDPRLWLPCQLQLFQTVEHQAQEGSGIIQKRQWLNSINENAKMEIK